MRAFTISICAATLCATSICGAQTRTWRFGAAAGQFKFSDGSQESAFGATAAARVWDWLDVSVNPTYAWAQSAAVQSSPTVAFPARRASGFTDLPVSIGISHAMSGAWSPSIGFSLGVTLPTGDTASLGSGGTGMGASVSLGIAPSDDLWFSVGAGRSLSNGYSTALAGSSSTSMALSGGTKAGPASISGSLSGDVGAVPAGFGSARSLAAGVALPVGAGMSLNIDGSAGLTRGTPIWAYSVGIGTTASGIAAASVAPYERLRHAFGAGTSTKNKPKTGRR